MLYFKTENGKKKQILHSLNIGVIFQNSTWFKENKILPSVKIGAMYI